MAEARPLCVIPTQFGDLVYFSDLSAARVLTVGSGHTSSLRFTEKSTVDFSLSAMFRFEPYFGRFPESKDAKEKVIKAQYGKPLKPGCQVSVKHVLTSTYISKAAREKDGAFRACLLKEKSDDRESPRLPDMCVTVISNEAWKDEGVRDGSKVQISISDSAHAYLFDIDKNPFAGDEAVFRLNQRDPHPITVHSFLHWRDCNEQSAKYGFVCQLKTNHGMFLASKPNLQSSACLHYFSKPPSVGTARVQEYDGEVLPEYWGEIPVDLTTDECDGNSYWILEQVASSESSKFAQFQGGVVCGGQHFRLKNVLSRRYLGSGFVLSSQESAQIFTFPYSGENSPERILERLNSTTPNEAEAEVEDIVEMFEQYPMLKVADERTSACLVGLSSQPTLEDVWGRLMQPFAWRLVSDSAVRQTLSFHSECTPDKLLKFEIRESDTRAAAKMLEIAQKMMKFVEFHKAIEDPDRFQLAEAQEVCQKTTFSFSSLRVSEIRVHPESDEEGEEQDIGMNALGDSRATQSLHAGQFYELKVLKSLLTRVTKVKELKLLIDAQIMSEILRLVIFVMSGESRINPEVKAIIESSFKDFLFKSKLVWNHLYSSRYLLNYLALNYTQELILVLEATKEYQLPQQFDSVMIATALSEKAPALAQLLDPDRRVIPPHDNERTVTELMTTHFSEIDSETFATRFPALIRQFSLSDSEVTHEEERWKDMKSCYKNLKESAERVDWLTARIEKREASGSMIQRLLPPILELFHFLVLVTYPEVNGSKGAMSQASPYDQENELDHDNAKQFVQSAFRLIQTFQYWVDFHAVKYYYENRLIKYSDLEVYIQNKLTLGKLDSLGMISFARALKIAPKQDLEKPLLSDSSYIPKPQEPEKDNITIAELLAKIAKCTRYRIQEHPSSLLKMIDKALNPAQSAASYIEKLCLKENFKELFRKVKTIRANGRFFAETTTEVNNCRISPDFRDNFKQYVSALQDLLNSLERVSPESRKSAQDGLVCAGFGMELKRLWNYAAMLGDEEESVVEMRSITFALSRYYATENPKLMKEVFRLLSQHTFRLSHPEYLKLLFEMNVLPRDDEVLKHLFATIISKSRCTANAAIQTIKQSFGLSDVGLRALLPFNSETFLEPVPLDSSKSTFASHIVHLTAALIERSVTRYQFPYTRRIRASIAQLFSQQERQAHLLSAMLKNVYLTDNLVKKYLQAWRYLILSYHAVLRMSVAVGAVRSVPGLPQEEKGGKRTGGKQVVGKPLTVMQVMESEDPVLKEIVSTFSPAEAELLSSCNFHIMSKKDIRDSQKQWQGKMQSLMERIIDYVCRSSNTSIQKEELQVLAEIVKDDLVAKSQVIEVLGRYRQYRYFFGLCRTALIRQGLAGAKDVEKQEALGLVTAFLKFFQAACDGCFAPFQNYMREQNEDQKDNVNLIDILARKLEDLIVDSSVLNAEDSEFASELAVTLLEAVSGPCSANIQAVCRYPRLLRGISIFVSRAIVAPEIQSKLETVIKRERKREKSFNSVTSFAASSGLGDFIKQRFPPSQQQTLFSDPRLMIIMGKMYIKEKKKELNTSAEEAGLRYAGVEPLKLSLCLQLVNLMIALLEGNERRPEKISELMPSVNFKKFEKVSERLIAGVDEEFFRRFETGLLELEQKGSLGTKRKFASPGAVMNFAMRCFILYYTSIPEDDIPESKSRLLKYIGNVEIEQPGQANHSEIHSVIFQVPFKALHLSWLDTENVLSGLSSNSREENLKTFVGQLDTYLGEMKFLQKLSQSRAQNYLRRHWKQTFWMSYAALVVVNVVMLFAFDDFDQVGYETDQAYWLLMTTFGLLHSTLRLVWMISYYVRFWHLIWFPLTGFEATNHLATLAHVDKPGTVKAFFDMELSQSLLNIRASGVAKMLFNFSLFPVSLIALWYPWLFPFMLLEVCSMESTLQNIIKAITNRYKQLMVTFAFSVLLMCVYAVLGFFWQEPCKDSQLLFEYVIRSVYYGMRDDKGIGEVMGEPQSLVFRFFFDMSFFILITTILMAIVFGIVVDTFGELRDEMNEAERNMTSICSICRQPRSSIEIRGEGWDKHCLLTHNPFAYLYFMAYVKEKDINDCSGVEKFVRQQLDHKDIGFFPTTFRERSDTRSDQ